MFEFQSTKNKCVEFLTHLPPSFSISLRVEVVNNFPRMANSKNLKVVGKPHFRDPNNGL